ncbi:MAG: DUF4328 domain-containing protein [Asticcacaulis sp.]|uniref:DUF4328 domain-containing protein n=1 Tax=Asticcacaulis sp. TaxID=1872648 RepID=UPI0039E29034
MTSQAPRVHTGKGQSIALVIMAGVDIVLGAIAIALNLALNNGTATFSMPSAEPVAQNTMIVGMLFLIMIVQIAVRSIMLMIMAWWSFRLISNAHRHTNFPVSRQWSWLGWFVPVVSLWLPVQAMLGLNLTHRRISGARRLIILSWWVARILASPTAGVLSFAGVVIIARLGEYRRDMSDTIISWLVSMMVIGILAQCLAIAVILLTQRNQPKPGIIVSADIF